MGKKARTASGKQRAALRKLNKKTLPEPPPPVEDEVRRKQILVHVDFATLPAKTLLLHCEFY
jgi:hypothetical protein